MHLVGIKGVAMTSMAQMLLDLGKTVSGSDVDEEFVTQLLLDKMPVEILAFNEQSITKDIDAVIYSGAHQGRKNPEVVRAHKLGIPVISHAEALGIMMNGKKGISVCGVGGKSTTSAMISWVLEKAGVRPSFSVGVGNILDLDKTGQYEINGSYFVAEADEYATDPTCNLTPRFMHQHPEIIVCTNLRYDHPDIYPSFEDTKKAYKAFFNNLQANGTLIINSDDAGLVLLATSFLEETGKLRGISLITVSQNDQAADYFLSAFEPSKEEQNFRYIKDGQEFLAKLHVPGQHNAFNALCAIVVAEKIGVPINKAIDTISSFQGTIRRFQNMGNKNGVQYFDDYAHHPIEIKRVLIELRKMYPHEKVTAVFQPHTYSRTKSLLNEFGLAFSDGNEVILFDIFASARESFDSSITSDMLVEKIMQEHTKAINLHDQVHVVEYLKNSVKPGDVVITLGAGDLYKLHEMIQ